MENVIEARGNSLQAEQGSAIVHCDRCACKMQLDKEEARVMTFTSASAARTALMIRKKKEAPVSGGGPGPL